MKTLEDFLREHGFKWTDRSLGLPLMYDEYDAELAQAYWDEANFHYVVSWKSPKHQWWEFHIMWSNETHLGFVCALRERLKDNKYELASALKLSDFDNKWDCNWAICRLKTWNNMIEAN